MRKTHRVVEQLVDLIKANQWKENFEFAIANARKQNLPQIEDIRHLDDYLDWMNELLYWAPAESTPGREVYNRLCKFYLILDQEPLLGLQNHNVPQRGMSHLTQLSAWMVEYAKAVGETKQLPALADKSR